MGPARSQTSPSKEEVVSKKTNWETIGELLLFLIVIILAIIMR